MLKIPIRCHDRIENFLTFNLPFYQANDVDSIQATNSTIIVDISDNLDLLNVRRLFTSKGLPNVIFLTSNYSESNGQDVLYFPSWLYFCSIKYENHYTIDYTRKRNYLASCLNRNCFPHKLYTHLQLLKKSYIDKCSVSFSNQYCVDAKLTPIDYTQPPFITDLPTSVLDEAKSTNLYRDMIVGYTTNWDNDHDIDNAGFLDTYLNITTETRHTQTLFTEKTAKPLATGQMFLQVNGPNSMDGLRTLGIEPFDDVLGNHEYDKASTFIDRVDQMLTLLDTVVPNMEDIYFSNVDKIKHNQEYFLSDSFRNAMISPLKEHGLING